MNSSNLDNILDNIKQILLSNGWDRPLPLEHLEQRYKTKNHRDLLSDCYCFGLKTVDDFIIRSELFRLFLKNGKTFVYLAPEKIDYPLPGPTVTKPQKKFKRKKKRKADVTVVKFKAMPWGTFEPMDHLQNNNQPEELKPRPAAFDIYSDEDEDDDCEFIEIIEGTSVESKTELMTINNQSDKPSCSNQTSIQPINPAIQPPSYNNTQINYISAQQIDGPTMYDFQEDDNHEEETASKLQDLSAYAMRQNECNSFSYNDLPKFRQCINFRAPYNYRTNF